MYVYYLTGGFTASTRAFILLTRAFSVLIRGFELIARGFELVTCGFELVTCNSCFTFPPFRTKTMEHHVRPDLEKKPDLVIIHTSTNDLKSVSSPEKITNKSISIALSMKEKDHQIAV